MTKGIEDRLGPGDRERLEAVIGSGNSPQKHVWRARTVLLSAAGIGTMASDRLRLDLVLNDFVASAVATGQIVVLSDGTPWRPLIDVRDMSRAIEWALLRDAANGGQVLSVNVGTADGNYQVKDLAAAVAEAVPGTSISINHNAQPDTRSYQVDFSLFGRLAPGHAPQVTLRRSIEGLHDGLTAMGFADREFRNSRLMRLKVLEQRIAARRLSSDLRWVRAFAERMPS